MPVPPAAVTHDTLLQMPERVRALSKAWPRLTGVVAGLTEEMEDEFRFGHTVVRVGDGYRMGGSIKGGSSSIWVVVDEVAKAAYEEWKQKESVSKGEDAEAYSLLKRRLGESGIEVFSCPDEYEAGHGGVYREIYEIVTALPEKHLRKLSLEKIRIGGWGPDAAKASAYRNGTVYIYDFAVNGASRTLGGLFLHEMGHAFHASLTPEQAGLLVECHETIARERALIGVEFLLDPESRIVYQEFIPDEFAAESYLLYTACGGMLREFISRKKNRVAKAWWEAYRILAESFGGIGYC
ncbi:MAG: hypothetical protein JW909_12210 [Planctomycetes bacterium]|nr:hypothetical protein [Planctomycetota bacterium]